MIDTDRASDGFVAVSLDGHLRLARAGERKLRELKADLDVGAGVELSVRIGGRFVRVENGIMILGGEAFFSGR